MREVLLLSLLQKSKLSLEKWNNLLRVTQEMAENISGSGDILNYSAVLSPLLAQAKALSECWFLSSLSLVVVLKW